MIIGLVGKAGVGKTTVADYLVKEYGFRKVSFKSALIDEMKEVFPDLLETLRQYHSFQDVDELFTLKPDIMRALMQNYGTEVRRKDDPQYWVKKWLKRVAVMVEHYDIVADDVRFINEADAVKLHTGKIVKLSRPDLVSSSQHQSETEQDNIEFDIEMVCAKGEHDKLYSMVDLYLKENGKEK